MYVAFSNIDLHYGKHTEVKTHWCIATKQNRFAALRLIKIACVKHPWAPINVVLKSLV